MKASRADKSISTTKNSARQLLGAADPFPTSVLRAGGRFHPPRPGASPAQEQPWAAAETSRLTPLSGKITVAVCKLHSEVRLGQAFSSHQGGGNNRASRRCGEQLCDRC